MTLQVCAIYTVTVLSNQSLRHSSTQPVLNAVMNFLLSRYLFPSLSTYLLFIFPSLAFEGCDELKFSWQSWRWSFEIYLNKTRPPIACINRAHWMIWITCDVRIYFQKSLQSSGITGITQTSSMWNHLEREWWKAMWPLVKIEQHAA